MKSIIALVCLFACAVALPDGNSRIVGGDPAVLYAHPHQASLQYYSGSWQHICGAVIVRPNKLLTAAHCVDRKSASSMRVQVGVLDLYNGPFTYRQTISVSRYTMHPNYNGNANGYPNDIAVLTLSSSMTYNNNVSPAALAPTGSSFADTDCLITGWGRTSGSGSGASHLKEAQMEKITNSACSAFWGSAINSGHICVYERSGVSSCMGDSGGPMMCGSNFGLLAGITSWGVSSCSGNLPSVYTRTSAYNSWINANI